MGLIGQILSLPVAPVRGAGWAAAQPQRAAGE